MLGLSACTFGVPVGGAHESSSNKLPAVSKSKYGNPSSYVVMGERYHVMESSQGFIQRGLASWYGADFHGKRTSSGEVYNMHAMTAAHKTLPIPVYVRVRNLSSGKSAVVLVNDRGPFVENRIIDLSYAAAKKLGVVGPGTAEVEIEALDTHKDSPRKTVRSIPLQQQPKLSETSVFIQLGSFGNVANAQNLLNDLNDNQEQAVVIQQVNTEKGDFYRVRLGPLLSINEANVIHARLVGKGYSNAKIVFDD
ncbi:MAG: septal ring lytic transglycosylase RlpA family protein [Gammaproteobacteria bacterium]|nr:septal ring lytic transglycosylase RlpA family protein [Gammaproteobacteria bacterium]